MALHVNQTSLSVKRCHGLGNVIMLLPVLHELTNRGVRVQLVTQTQWLSALRTLCPELNVTDRAAAATIDLDAATCALRPQEHRSREFADILGLAAPLPAPGIEVPAEWSRPFLQWRGAIGFAPEAGHQSRQWPLDYVVELANQLKDAPLVLLGMARAAPLPCAFDTRGCLSLEDLFGLLNVMRLLICMDSGMLHLGGAVGVPTISIFGGIDPRYRIHENQRVLALQADLGCSPCNKAETCDERYDCVKGITPRAVLDAVAVCLNTSGRVIRRV